MTFTVIEPREGIRLYRGDCLEVLPTLEANSVNLIAVDPPYYRVKGEWWDRQWDTAQGFLAWIGQLCEQWQRVLKPNGSLYVFASPQMAARVECKIGERFNVLNRIRWLKEAGWHNKARPEDLRSYLSPWEEIVFAEHYGADSYAKGEAGYSAKCDELRGFVFEPLRAYLAGEFAALGWDGDRLNEICGTASMAARHYTSRSQWCLPTAEHYAKLQAATNNGHLRREYEDLRREYGHLRREYEDLRRPFTVTANVPYTDVWDFPTVSAYRGKHPCEKPLSLMEHIITTSSKPGDTVLDCCLGSGATLEAATKLGRRFVGGDIEQHWIDIAVQRIMAAQAPLPGVDGTEGVQ